MGSAVSEPDAQIAQPLAAPIAADRRHWRKSDKVVLLHRPSCPLPEVICVVGGDLTARPPRDDQPSDHALEQYAEMAAPKLSAVPPASVIR